MAAPPDAPEALDMLTHDVRPDAYKQEYHGGETVSFTIMAGPNRALIPGTLMLEGSIQVAKIGTFPTDDPGTVLSVADFIFCDAQTGLHGAIQGTNTATEANGQLENITAYPQTVRMMADATTSRLDLLTKSKIAALRAPVDYMTSQLLTGTLVKESGSNTTSYRGGVQRDATFSFPPQIAVNRANGPIAFSRTGQIRITFRLADARNFLFGPGVGGSTDYRLLNLNLRYNTIPSDDAPPQVMARTDMTSQHTLSTQTTSIDAIFPAGAVDSFTLSFRNQASLSDPTQNHLITERLTGLNLLTFTVNESLTGPVTKPIYDEVEALMLGMESMGSSMHNSQEATRLARLDGWLLGYPLGSPTNVAQVPFGLIVSADAISNLTPFLLTIVAHATIAF